MKLNSSAVASYYVAHDMFHVMSARCVARDLHTITSWLLERTCWRQFAAQLGDYKKKSYCALQCDHFYYYHHYGWLVKHTHTHTHTGFSVTDERYMYTCTDATHGKYIIKYIEKQNSNARAHTKHYTNHSHFYHSMWHSSIGM